MASITMATVQEKMKQLKEKVEKIEGMSGSDSFTVGFKREERLQRIGLKA